MGVARLKCLPPTSIFISISLSKSPVELPPVFIGQYPADTGGGTVVGGLAVGEGGGIFLFYFFLLFWKNGEGSR